MIKKPIKKSSKTTYTKRKRSTINTKNAIIHASPWIYFMADPSDGFEGQTYRFVIIEDTTPNVKLKYIIKKQVKHPYKRIESLPSSKYFSNEFKYLIDAQFEMERMYSVNL
jgi:hypothetical protein